jgi:hypothetical protein
MSFCSPTSEPPPLIESSPWPKHAGLLAHLGVAYRQADGDEYVVLYPPGRIGFAVA